MAAHPGPRPTPVGNVTTWYADMAVGGFTIHTSANLTGDVDCRCTTDRRCAPRYSGGTRVMAWCGYSGNCAKNWAHVMRLFSLVACPR